MSTLTLKRRAGGSLPAGRLNLIGLTPDAFAGQSHDAIAKHTLSVGSQTLALGDVFDVSGSAGETLVIEGSCTACDFIGHRLKHGTIIVDGDVGGYAGRLMSNGHLDIKGGAGPYLASRQSGGLITVSGSAGDFAGGIMAGEKFGMTGGIVIVEGDFGKRAGDRMRRGTLIARGRFGHHAASRMMGGTLWTETGFGPEPGPLLRRGTLIGPAVEQFLPTFVDGGLHDLNILGIISRFMANELGARAPKALPRVVRKYSGDMATIGKGELLLTEV